MARFEAYPDFVLRYKMELKSVVHGHHIDIHMDINRYGHPLLVRSFSLLQTKEKKRSVTMSLQSAHIKTKSVVYWLGINQSKFQTCPIIF